MSEIKNQLEIVDVQFEDNNQKALFILLDEEMGEIREVAWNRQSFDKEAKKFVPDEKKAADVDLWCEEHFQIPFTRLGETIGLRKDVYCYDKFNSFWEVQQIAKFDEEMLGQILSVEIIKAEDDGRKISMIFEYEGQHYESKMQYADWLESRQEWFVNPVKRKKQYTKFEEKFGLLVGEIEQMVGKTVLVEVKKALGKYIYNEIKPLQKPKSQQKKKSS